MPQFAPGSAHVATPVFSNPKSAGFDYSASLCMGAALTEMASASFHLDAGQSKSVPFSVTMPTTLGTYPVYLKVSSGGVLIGTFVATEGVVIYQPAAINIVSIQWDQMAATPWPGNYQYSPYFLATDHTALITFQNPTSVGFDYQAELYLAPQALPLRSADSASISFHIDAGQSKSIPFSFPSPGRPHLYNAYTMRLRITSSGKFLPGEFTLKVILPANAMGWDAPSILATGIVPDVGELLAGERRVRHVFNESGADLSGIFAYYSDAWIMERYPTWTITYTRYRDYTINWGSFTLPGVGWNPSATSTHVPMPQDDLTMFFVFFWAVAPSGPGYTYYDTTMGARPLYVKHVYYGDVMTFDFNTKQLTVVPSREVVYP